MTIHYQPITQQDSDLLWEMLYQALHVPPGAPPFPRDIVHDPLIARYAEAWGREGDLGWWASEQQRPIGAAWTRLWPGPEKAGFGYVGQDVPELSMAVIPDYRNRGVGTALLEKVIEQCRDHYPAISLSVSESNPALRLYQRLGFETLFHQDQSVTMLKRWGR